jgi:type I restriction enzyme M protein
LQRSNILNMTNEEIKKLETELWGAADELRANSKLTAAEYKDPVLGLILLRYAQNKFEEAKAQIEETLPINPRTGSKRELTKNDLLGAGAMYLQAESQYEHLANLPESADIAEAVNNAMRLIEADYKDLQGILPKNYQEFDADLLRSLIRVFNKDAVKNITGDVFGRIYEFFLMKFSMSGAGAQEGGEFFTPPSLVQLIVNFIEPDHGIIHDPACGSGGMFVQTGHFIKSKTNKQVNEAIKVYGTELKSNNVRLAKMNLAIHGIEGKIIENNSFYSNPHELTGKCDFVMANPPFNVKKIDKGKDYVKTDPRLPFGVPNADNGNYMWIQYFNSYLNEKGRAGFVMASSATDAGNSEKLIREKLIATKTVDVIVSVGNNFFYTRSLPCHLWFFDKGKPEANKDKILMIDARNTYRVVSSTINDFSDGQLLNLTTIVQLYRGNAEAISQAEQAHKQALKEQFEIVNGHYIELAKELKQLSVDLKNEDIIIPEKIDFSNIDNPQAAKEIYKSFEKPAPKVSELITYLEKEIAKITAQVEREEIEKKTATGKMKPFKDQLNKLNKPLKAYQTIAAEFLKELKQRISDWKKLLEYFPENKYVNVEGLCKIVDLEEIKENDYTLTPGRFVGYKIQVDEDFDYKTRMSEIHKKLDQLNNQANEYMSLIQKIDF